MAYLLTELITHVEPHPLGSEANPIYAASVEAGVIIVTADKLPEDGEVRAGDYHVVLSDGTEKVVHVLT